MRRGGKRKGSGRPFGKGPHGEKTVVMRVPISLTEEVREFVETKGYRIPVFLSRVPAGPPAEASDCIEEYTKLKNLLPHPKNIGVAFVSGDSMVNVGMFDGDALLFDSQQQPKHRDIVIALIDGEQTVKRLHIIGGKCMLLPENDSYQPITVAEGMDFKITGIVKLWLRKP
jgi:DNA polymerase V